MRLLVISHTPHFRTADGTIVGWGPTVRELNYLKELFSEVVHIAPLHNGVPPATSLGYDSHVRFIPIIATGGTDLRSKLFVLWQLPRTIAVVRKHLSEADWFQLRVPTGIGVYLIPYLSCVKNNGWFKYAGNWIEKNPPLSYRWQRFLLSKIFKSRKVTLNGRWTDLPAHCIPFENPCLTDEELFLGSQVSNTRTFEEPLRLLFVGRIEYEKGVGKILEMFSLLEESVVHRIKEIVFIGNGAIDHFKQYATGNVTVHFIGARSRKDLNEFYRGSHILLLPSYASEGFPKVIAEAAAWGCIPFVSNVSAVSQYVTKQNGHVFSDLSPQKMAEEFVRLIQNPGELAKRSNCAREIANRFSYSEYNKNIASKVINALDRQ